MTTANTETPQTSDGLTADCGHAHLRHDTLKHSQHLCISYLHNPETLCLRFWPWVQGEGISLHTHTQTHTYASCRCLQFISEMNCRMWWRNPITTPERNGVSGVVREVRAALLRLRPGPGGAADEWNARDCSETLFKCLSAQSGSGCSSTFTNAR